MKTPMFIDVRGGGEPLVGRLRGVVARHELRPVLEIDDAEHIYFEASDPHFVFKREPPKKLPDCISNTERQLVVSPRLAKVLTDLVPKLVLHAVRLDGPDGKAVSSDFALVEFPSAVQCAEVSDGENFGGYLYDLNRPKPPKKKVPAVFRVAYSRAIACSADAAPKLAPFAGVTLVPFGDYVDLLMPEVLPTYELLRCGTEGAELSVAGGKFEDALEKGEPLLKGWKKKVAKMVGPRSRKKVVDFTDAGGAPLITAKARAVLEPFGLDGVELLPVAVKDHAGQPVKGDFWLMHVAATRPYVDVAESDIEVTHDLYWTAREIVVDEQALTDRPAFFRVPGARYPWVFVRRDVAEAMTAANLAGFRTESPLEYAHSVEGGGLPSVC